MMWGSSDDVTVMLNHFKGEKIFEILFIYNKEKPFENTNNPARGWANAWCFAVFTQGYPKS